MTTPQDDRTIPLFPEALADLKKACEGQRYRPSNATEGEYFMSNWCYQCANWEEDDFGYSCGIQLRSMVGHLDEWIIDRHGQPKCTAYAEESVL